MRKIIFFTFLCTFNLEMQSNTDSSRKCVLEMEQRSSVQKRPTLSERIYDHEFTIKGVLMGIPGFFVVTDLLPESFSNVIYKVAVKMDDAIDRKAKCLVRPFEVSRGILTLCVACGIGYKIGSKIDERMRED